MNNPPAFSGVANEGGWNEGMTLRDYFAAKALQALLSCPDCDDDKAVVEASFHLADMMLKERANAS